MKSFKIRLQSIEEVKKFVSIMAQFNGYFDLVSGKYIVDAKSVMGIFSMDLSKALELRILETNEQESAIQDALKHYIVNE
ncbi:phosphotransferase system HPr-like phosphotransfer protein [Kineothrix alysoides]|uniref:Phosphotransferase system HPr-like phosphotransfer protein n=1 Tax=Kineothrix alysoides TaxID=1469948 RepID=A0A4R1QRQ2_9FIRM|nr:HPr family phosphocarrier protein [Kineothrix alysoides]TCL55653.1 phosphotransferase system HPr-like phosphotransfer protein [Kineothrix alysoides]